MPIPVTIAAATTHKEIFDLLRDDLAAIEVEFGKDTISSVGLITDIGEYLRGSGGKRIRPALLLLAARLMGYSGRGSIRLAAVMEIIHTATLVHDDILDGASTRRGRPAANTRWDNSTCVLAGDWLYMQAFKIAVQERDFRILDLLTDLTQQMVEGEILQNERLGSFISLEEYFDLIFRKTACLFSVCMRLGGLLGGATPEQEQRLGDYGRNLGLAFQIVDDVLDLTASEEVLGKPVASDLREGKVTMAVIHALDHCTVEEREMIKTVLRERAFKSVSHEETVKLLERYGSIDAAHDAATTYSHLALDAITIFPESEIKRALLFVPEFVVDRQK